MVGYIISNQNDHAITGGFGFIPGWSWRPSHIHRMNRIMVKYGTECLPLTPENIEHHFTNLHRAVVDNVTADPDDNQLIEEVKFLDSLDKTFYKYWALTRIQYYLQMMDVGKYSLKKILHSVTLNAFNDEDIDPEDFQNAKAKSVYSEYSQIVQYIRAYYIIYDHSEEFTKRIKQNSGFVSDSWFVKKVKNALRLGRRPKAPPLAAR